MLTRSPRPRRPRLFRTDRWPHEHRSPSQSPSDRQPRGRLHRLRPHRRRCRRSLHRLPSHRPMRLSQVNAACSNAWPPPCSGLW